MNSDRQRTQTFRWFIKRPRTTGALVALLLISISVLIAAQRYKIAAEAQRREMQNILDLAHLNLQQALRSTYTATLTQALTINDNGEPENFELISARIMESHPLISSVQWAPKGIIRYIYPGGINHKVMNYNILTAASDSLDAIKSLKDGKLYFSGPRALLQGGTGILARLPVFRNKEFWGFSSVLIHTESLMQTAGVNTLDGHKYFFQLRKIDPITGKSKPFLKEPAPITDKLSISKALPEGNLEITLVARNRYEFIWPLVPILILGLLLSVIFAIIVIMLLEKPAEFLRKSEARFESLFNDSPTALWVEDFSGVKNCLEEHGLLGKDSNYIKNFLKQNPDLLKKCTEKVRVIDLNNECLRLYAPLTKEELLNGKIATVLSAQSPDAFISQLCAVASGTPKIAVDTFQKSASGEYLDLYLQWSVMKGYEATLERVIVSCEDITLRKKNEQIVFRSQQRIESLINTIDGIVWESDYVLDKITFVNQKAEEIAGYPVSDWTTEKDFWINHVHPEDRDKAMQTYHTNIQELNQFDFEYRFLRQDGSVIWIKDHINVVHENQRPAYIRGIMIDVTRSKESEKKLGESLKLVIEQNKRLQNFSYIVSHNLRSHTSNIQSIAVLMEAAGSEQERNQMIQMLKTVSNSLNETMTNLNEVVNIQTNVTLIREEINLSQYIENTLNVLSEQIIKKNARVQNLVPDSVSISFNPAYIESILLNLVSNGLRYSSRERTPEVMIEWLETDGNKILEVRDNGIGIDLEKHRDDLFGMYKTFSNNPESKGIGLFITKNQIDAMGAEIFVESTPNVGTSFRIHFK